MHKLQESRLTLNFDKYEVGVDSMFYMRDVFSGEGLKISSEQVKAIVDAPAPHSASKVRSFLGSAQLLLGEALAVR